MNNQGEGILTYPGFTHVATGDEGGLCLAWCGAELQTVVVLRDLNWRPSTSQLQPAGPASLPPGLPSAPKLLSADTAPAGQSIRLLLSLL